MGGKTRAIGSQIQQVHGGGGGLPDPFLRMGEWRNSTESKHSGNAPRSRPKIGNRDSIAKDGRAERVKSWAVEQSVGEVLQRVATGAA